jgi:hypothetical protein
MLKIQKGSHNHYAVSFSNVGGAGLPAILPCGTTLRHGIIRRHQEEAVNKFGSADFCTARPIEWSCRMCWFF